MVADRLASMPRLAIITVAALCCLVAGANAADPRIAMLGRLELPDAIAGPNDTTIRLVGLSGITWLGDDAWAAIMDNNDKLVTFSIAIAEDGSPLETTEVAVTTVGTKHDYEDIAPCPPALQRRIAGRLEKRGEPAPGRCVLVCEEDTPAVRGLSLADGRLLGAVPLPELVTTCRSNRGLESLALDPDGRRIWTANEESFLADGPASGTESGTLVRLISITLPDDADDNTAGEDAAARGGSEAQFAYRVDPPHEMVAAAPDNAMSGVSALVALGEGRLLVLERSGGMGLPPFENRIYLVETAGAKDVSAIDALANGQGDLAVSKRLLWQDALGCNMEGLAIGPSLPDGQRLLVGIADNGHVGGPTQLIFFTLQGGGKL